MEEKEKSKASLSSEASENTTVVLSNQSIPLTKKESSDLQLFDIKLKEVRQSLENYKEDFSRLEKSMDRVSALMTWLAAAVIVTFLLSFVLIVLDYFYNNDERYEKFIDKTIEIQKDFYSKDDINTNFINKSDFYSKDQLNSLFIDDNKDSQTIDCLKIKGYFSTLCFQ